MVFHASPTTNCVILWARHFIPLSLSFFIYKMETLTPTLHRGQVKELLYFYRSSEPNHKLKNHWENREKADIIGALPGWTSHQERLCSTITNLTLSPSLEKIYNWSLMSLGEWVDPFPCQEKQVEVPSLHTGNYSTLSLYKANYMKLPPLNQGTSHFPTGPVLSSSPWINLL